jgi:hypothetical protein
MRRLALSLLLLAGNAVAQDAALRTLDACRARLDPRLDVGIERVQWRCPELLPALQRAPWKGLLPTALGQRREEISAQSLGALSDLIRHAQDPGTNRPPPKLDALAPVLEELGAAGKQGATRWERFKRWLREKFERRHGPAEQGWLDRLRSELSSSEGVMRALTYVCYGLVIALVLFVIAAELRAAGLLGGRGRASRRAAAAAEWRRRLLLADIMSAPLSERPGMLLRLLGEALTRVHRLPAADGLTAPALVRRARLDQEPDREALARVAAAAEQRRYGARPPDDTSLEGAVDTARDLLGRIARLRGTGR